MSKLQMVKVVSRKGNYNQTEFDIVTIDGEYPCRTGLNKIDLAYEIADRIDADMVYERDNNMRPGDSLSF